MISTPTLLLNEKIARSNIARMVNKAERNNTVLRPHFKTHQSHEVGRWFREAGVEQITTSSLSMAGYFSQDGWKDITVAFPVNLLEIDLINDLAGGIKLNLLVESAESARFLSTHCSSPVNIFIKIDLGTHRTGLEPWDTSTIGSILTILDQDNPLSFAGFLGHSGHSYGARSNHEILEVHEYSKNVMGKLMEMYTADHPTAIISVGDTPTCSVAEDFSWADEMRPGNFVFYDLMQLQIGSCTLDQIAVAVACPVVALHPERNEVILYGGGVHFSKDNIMVNDQQHFGAMVENTSSGWGELIDGAFLKKLSQEHGTLHIPDNLISQIKVGDLVKILPVHSCMTANLLKEYTTIDNHRIKMFQL